MKNMLKNFLRVLPLGALMLVAFNNCSQFQEAYLDSLTGSYDNASTGIIDPETDSEKLGIPYALLSAEQTLHSMMSLANVTTVSTAINNEYNSRYGSLAAGNDLSMANAPLMLGSTSLAGEICNSLITAERAQAAADRAIFGQVNFTTGISSVSDQAFNASIRGMARQFWGRNENLTENTLLHGFKTEFSDALAANVRTQAASTINLMMATCAAMLSSLDAISY